MKDECHTHTRDDGSWWESDARGVPLCRVCDKCIDEKLARYRPEILTGYDQNDVDEPIDGDESDWRAEPADDGPFGEIT